MPALDTRILTPQGDPPVHTSTPARGSGGIAGNRALGDGPCVLAETPAMSTKPEPHPAVPAVAGVEADVRDDLAQLITATTNTDDPILRAKCDDIARRIVRDGGRTNFTALAREVGSSPTTIKRLIGTPTFRRVYDQVSEELLGTVDDRIVDERLDVLSRQDSLQRRAMTVLADCMAIVRAHRQQVIGGANPRPGLLKLGVDAAAEIRQLGIAARGAGAGGMNVNVGITINRTHATIIQQAIAESGIDLSDIVEGIVIDQQREAS
jgi:hypothetical protein